ncbi:TolB-like 6-bladed beta-propeller domain-containing protein [Bacteroides muris (ex Fokt et al. 2023)]|uniref:TolB-like 6-bladed beta-propeller domain-containing protein n=1 Tax=Bacteroides muris (ex Fokt et al. 2023) TaxID=2937417 RepID=A0A9X2NP08_9BACE|nr:TolB-like 6-bladed beta-propeller domain-containing protein [Bacteroides muris (ex Fokt et al. 2023)]MCR6503753.1 TolB-like 6-bladed beta-propeller domain-containing protein [Bacteroides muris (ex Fokt et al. 2023)]
MKIIPFFLFLFCLLSCNSVNSDIRFVDLSNSIILQAPEQILEFEDKYPTSIKVVDSLLFVIYVKADTCIDVFNLYTKQKISSLGPVGHGDGDLINPNFILSIDKSGILLDEGNLKRILEIKCGSDSMWLQEYITYPDPIFISSETNLSENFIVGRKIDAIDGKMFFVYNRATDEVFEVDSSFELEETVSDYNYTYAPTITFNEQQNRIIAGMYFFDMIHVFDLEGKHINSFNFSEKSIPSVNKNTKMLALENGYSGFIRCFPTEKYCYLLRMTVSSRKEDTEKMLIQIDWNGNLINSYKFADNVSGQFCIDEYSHKIYIIRNGWSVDRGEFFEVVSYNLR